MKSLQLLRAEADQTRIYRTESSHRRELEWHVQDFCHRIPGHDWNSHFQIVAGKPGRGMYDMAVKHMIHWGSADARVIEDAFHVVLPPSVHEFYHEIQEAVFLWKETFHFLHPREVVSWEREYRLLSDEEDLPVHLIRFCKLDTKGDSVALRLNSRTGKWGIQYAAVGHSTEEIQSAKCDGDDLAKNLDEWLVYLMEHDGLICPDDRQWLERVG